MTKRSGRRPSLSAAPALWSILLAGVLLPGCALSGTRSMTARHAEPNPRVIVLSDIGGDEPDDEQSLIRLMLYSNEIDVEGLIANTSVWQPRDVHPELIRGIVEAYGQVRPNLLVHAPGYPPAEALLGTIRSGRLAVGMEGVGDGMSTAASELIIEAVDRPDPRPVWILLWGGGTDFAQALWEVRSRRAPEETERFVAKLRVYDIAGQDDVGAWAAHTFPGLFWVRNIAQFQGISRRFDGTARFAEARGGNEAVMEPEWVERNVQGHGPLGALYRHAHYKYEGDTPAFLHLLPTGLGDPEQVHFGTWGGRFTAEKQKNLPAVPRVTTQGKYHDYWMFGDAEDTWTYDTVTYHNRFAPLFRWREAFQNDFAARMDWSVTPRYEDANHNPVAALDGDPSARVVYRTVRSGAAVRLSAAGSSDPDGDRLSFHWWHYREPGSFPGDVPIREPAAAETSLVAPRVDAPRTIHIVLTVRDDGEPSLYSYKRLVLTVVPE